MKILKVIFAVAIVQLMVMGLSSAKADDCGTTVCSGYRVAKTIEGTEIELEPMSYCTIGACTGGFGMPVTIDDDGNVIENPKLGVVGHYIEGDPYLIGIPFMDVVKASGKDAEKALAEGKGVIVNETYIGFTCKHDFIVVLNNGNSDFLIKKYEGIKALEAKGMSDEAIPVFKCDEGCAETEFIDDASRLNESPARIRELKKASSQVDKLLGGKDEGMIK